MLWIDLPRPSLKLQIGWYKNPWVGTSIATLPGCAVSCDPHAFTSVHATLKWSPEKQIWLTTTGFSHCTKMVPVKSHNFFSRPKASKSRVISQEPFLCSENLFLPRCEHMREVSECGPLPLRRAVCGYMGHFWCCSELSSLSGRSAPDCEATPNWKKHGEYTNIKLNQGVAFVRHSPEI